MGAPIIAVQNPQQESDEEPSAARLAGRMIATAAMPILLHRFFSRGENPEDGVISLSQQIKSFEYILLQTRAVIAGNFVLYAIEKEREEYLKDETVKSIVENLDLQQLDELESVLSGDGSQELRDRYSSILGHDKEIPPADIPTVLEGIKARRDALTLGSASVIKTRKSLKSVFDLLCRNAALTFLAISWLSMLVD